MKIKIATQIKPYFEKNINTIKDELYFLTNQYSTNILEEEISTSIALKQCVLLVGYNITIKNVFKHKDLFSIIQ